MCHWYSCRSLHSTSNLFHDVIATKSEQVDGILFFLSITNILAMNILFLSSCTQLKVYLQKKYLENSTVN